MKKRCISFFVVFCMTALLLVMPAGAEKAFNKDSLNGVALIVTDMVVNVQMDDGVYQMSLDEENVRGSGFFVGRDGENPEYLITNYHVVANIVEARERGNFVCTIDGEDRVCNAELSHIFVVYDQNQLEEIFVVDYDKNKDLALLRLENPTNKRVPLTVRIPDKSVVGEKVFSLGYPALSDLVGAATSSYGVGDITVTSGVISRLLTEQGSGTKQLQIDAAITGGNSGGPLVDIDGYVLGVNTSGAVAVESMNYAVSMEDVVVLLDRNRVTYQIKGENGDFPMGIVIGAVAVVVLIVILAVVLSKKKEKSSPVSVNPGISERYTEDIPVAEPIEKTAHPVLYSLDAQYRGMEVSVGMQNVLIGRDAQNCGFVYQSSTPGVSSHHCTVSWDSSKQVFLLTDVGSRFGTFLANGQKLNAGVVCQLHPGDTFYLGDRNNAMRVDLR